MEQLADYMLVTPVILTTVAGQLMATRGRFPLPGPTTLVVLLAVAAGLAFQLAVPGTLQLLQRDAAGVAGGQLWRLFTALFVQDGGLVGGLFNLLWLFLAGGIAERIWSRPAWLGLYFGGGIICEVVALVWEPVGGGNSVAYFTLCGAMLAIPLRRPVNVRVRIIAGFGLAVGIILALLANIHGAAVLVGAAGGLVLAQRAAVRESAA